MTIIRMCQNAQHISEFAGGYNGTCTQTSAAVCLAAAQNTPTTADDVTALMLSMTKQMIADGTASANGAATLANMAAELRKRGAIIATEWDYQGDRLPQDWHTLIKNNAGVRPILLQLANAQAIHDVSGAAEDQNVHYHAIAVVGIADNGYVVSDPNNPTVASTFDIYNYQALYDASPCGLIMLDMPVPMPAPESRIPTGWRDDGTTLTAPNGLTMTGPMRAYVLDPSHAWRADDIPLEEAHETADSARLIQTCNFSQLRHVQATGDTFTGNIGADLLALEALTASPDAQATALVAALKGAPAVVAALKAIGL